MRQWFDSFEAAQKVVEKLQEKFGVWPGIRKAKDGRYFIDYELPANKSR